MGKNISTMCYQKSLKTWDGHNVLSVLRIEQTTVKAKQLIQPSEQIVFSTRGQGGGWGTRLRTTVLHCFFYFLFFYQSYIFLQLRSMLLQRSQTCLWPLGLPPVFFKPLILIWQENCIHFTLIWAMNMEINDVSVELIAKFYWPVLQYLCSNISSIAWWITLSKWL